jgi:hypothetical protein
MRRAPVLLTLAALGAALTACGDAGSGPGAAGDAAPPAVEAAAPATGGELLFLGSTDGVRVLDVATRQVTVDARPGVPAQQGTTVVRAVGRAGGTEVAAFEAATGATRWSTVLAGAQELRVASQDGSAVVLGPPRPDDGSVPGREHTRLTVVRGPDDVRTYDVEANVEPETFSADASRLFVVEYLPPLAPTQYTVRLLDLGTGELADVRDVHGEPRAPMEGTARTQVYSPDGTRLYTYYEIVGDEPYVVPAPQGGVHAGHPEVFYAFVHVLDLADGWAHCVELAPPFGTAPGPRAGLAVSPDGGHLYVADATLGLVAEVDTETLRTTRSARVAPETVRAFVSAAATDDTLWVALDHEVHAVARDSLSARGSFTLAAEVLAVHPGRDALYVSLPSRVAVHDPVTLARVDEIAVGELPAEYLDPGGVAIEPNGVVKCAC